MHPAAKIILQRVVAKVMRIATSTTGTDAMNYYKTGLLNTSKTTVLESSLRVETSGTSFSHSLQLANGSKLAIIVFKVGSIVCGYYGAAPVTVTVDTSVYHTYSIEFQNTTQAVFKVDNSPVATISYANLYAFAQNCIAFGDRADSANAGGSVVYRAMRYNLDYVGTPASFVEWDSSSFPSTQGWTADGSESLASIIEE